MKYFLMITLFLLTFLATQSLSQVENLPKEINEAIELIDSKEFSSALVQLQSLRDKYPERKSLIDFLFIKCYDELDRFENVEIFSEDFLNSYPSSRYSNDVQTFLIKSLVNQNKFEKAFANSIELLKKTSSIPVKVELKSYIENAIATNLSTDLLQKYSELEKDNQVLPFILFLTAKKFYEEGNSVTGEEYVDRIRKNHITSDEYLLAINLKYQTNHNLSSEVETIVGVMLPLTSDNNEPDIVIQQILDGIKYAFHEFNRDREDKIGLIIEDTKNDSSEIVRIIKEFNADKRIKCVLGPIFSTEASDVIKNIKLTDLVFISPTATDEDLTQNNQQFYQANPPFDLRGKALAQYVFFVESRKSFAVLNSIEGYSTVMANAFVEEFKKLGGDIVLKETFKNLATDISPSFAKLKNDLNKIDGIYLPISKGKDAELIITELEKLDLKIPVFGTQDWLEAKGLESSTNISKNIRITSDFFIDYQDTRFNEFSSEFSELLGKEPNRYVLYGYDAAKHLITAIRGTTPSRVGIKLKLNSGMKTVGFKNNISFGSKRRNTYINILKYSDGKFSLVERFKANE